MIRRVTGSDLLQVINLTEKFWEESITQTLFGEFDALYYQRMLIQLMNTNSIVGWASFSSSTMQSVLLASEDTLLWKNVKILKEIMWYTDPKFRGSPSSFKLLKKMEEYAKENKFQGISMGRIHGVPNHERLNQFYLKNSFQPMEESYIKKL